MDNSRLATFIILWLCTAVALAAVRTRRNIPGSGLMVAYVINFGMIHVVAPALYLLPWYQNYDSGIVELGLEQSTYGIVAFAIGSLVLTPFILNTGIIPRPTQMQETDDRLPKAYLVIGLAGYMMLTTALGSLPSATALFSTGQQLIVVGLALCCWQAWTKKDYRRLAMWVILTLLMPIGTILTRGFIGYGTVATLSVLIFLSNFIRNRTSVVVGALLLGYLGLSVYVTYMRDRGEIRDSVWGGQPLKERVEQLQTTFSKFEWFDVNDREHLLKVDGRLNQSYLVGLAVSRIEDQGDFANGSTLWEALLALIPRALWPDKPMVAGSGTVVSEYTGLQFAQGTSVGVGQVMEFYINFGTLGVLIGFAITGILITILDLAAAERLAMHDLHGFVVWYLPGISLLQVGGSLIEVTTSAAASILVALLANRYLDRLQRNKVDRTETESVLFSQ